MDGAGGAGAEGTGTGTAFGGGGGGGGGGAEITGDGASGTATGGAGGHGGGIHTLQEWYDPTGRETALRRILLTLLDTTQTIADSHHMTA